MKKYKLRKLAKYSLMVIAYLSFMVMGSESENLLMFIISHVASAIVFAVSVSLLAEH